MWCHAVVVLQPLKFDGKFDTLIHLFFMLPVISVPWLYCGNLNDLLIIFSFFTVAAECSSQFRNGIWRRFVTFPEYNISITLWSLTEWCSAGDRRWLWQEHIYFAVDTSDVFCLLIKITRAVLSQRNHVMQRVFPMPNESDCYLL